MVTLNIQHAISDYQTWRSAFDRHESARKQAGVTGHRIRQPVDDSRYVVVDLEFPTAERAEDFLGFLRQVVWAAPENSPALVGSPTGRVLIDAD